MANPDRIHNFMAYTITDPEEFIPDRSPWVRALSQSLAQQCKSVWRIADAANQVGRTVPAFDTVPQPPNPA